MRLRLYVFFCQFLWLVSVLNGKSYHGVPGYGKNLIIKTIPAVNDYQSNVYEVYMEPYLYELGTGAVLAPAISGDRMQKQINLAYRLKEVMSYFKGIAQNGTASMLVWDKSYTTFYNKENKVHIQYIHTKSPRSAPGLQAVVHLQPDGESGVAGDLIFTQILANGPVTIEGNITGLSPGLHGIHVHQVGSIKDNCKEIGPHFIAYYGRHGGPRDHIRHVGDLGNIKAEEGTPVNVKIVDHLISLSGPRSILGRSLAISKSEDDYGRAGTEDSAMTGTSGPALACGLVGYLY